MSDDSKMMGFGCALASILAGHRVCRSNDHGREYSLFGDTVQDGETLILCNKYGTTFPWIPTQRELLATDWKDAGVLSSWKEI